MYQETRLKNGVRVLTIPMAGRESISLGFWVKVGGRFESDKLSGVSHFIEHLVFKGTEHFSMHAIKEKIEGKGGMLNAFTGEESTCFYTKIVSEHSDTAFDVLSSLICDPLLRKTDMDKERTVILEEIKMYLDMPSSYVHEIMGEMLWETQPLGRNIAGTNETVSQMSCAELKDFYNSHYHPVNILVTACGNMSHRHLVQEVEKRFRKLPVRGESCYAPARSAQGKPKLRFLDKGTEQCHWVLGLHALEKNHPDRYKLGLLHVILGANMSSRLFNEVREKRGLAYSIHSGVSSFLDTGAFTVSAGVAPKNAAAALRISLKELKRIARTGVTPEELRRAKDYFLGQLFLMLEDTLDHMIWAGERYLHFGNWMTRKEIQKEVEKVTCGDVQEMARRIFLTEHLNFASIGPLSVKTQNEIKKFFSFENC